MSATGDDKLHIPIEIKTDDLKELQAVINDISKAESDLRALPRKGKSKDSTSRAAFTGERETPFSGGIFEQSRETALPIGKDKTSKQAIQKDNAFRDLRDRVDNIEEGTSKIQGAVMGMAQNLGFAGILTNFGNDPKAKKQGALPIGFTQRAQAGANAASGALSFAKGGIGGMAGMLGSIATKAILPVAIASTIYELVTSILQELFRPGGFLDRRYRQVIDDEVASLTSRQEKAELQQGIRILRITPVAGFRGPSTARLAAAYDRNQQVWLNDFNMESRSKGFFD